MAKAIAIVVLLVSLACGSGSNETAFLRGATRTETVLTGSCTNAPYDCGVKGCIDCTPKSPPGTEPSCVASKCTFPCAPGFHNCGGACLSDTDARSCGSSCIPCPRSPNAIPFCGAGACRFTSRAG